MATDDRVGDEGPRSASGADTPKTNKRGRGASKDVGQAVKDAAVMGATAASLGPAGVVGLSIWETLKSLRNNRSSAVMARVSKEDLQRLDDLVDCGLTSSRSESAAFLIAEGIKARAELYEMIHEQSRVIRNAREEIRRVLSDESSPPSNRDSE